MAEFRGPASDYDPSKAPKPEELLAPAEVAKIQAAKQRADLGLDEGSGESESSEEESDDDAFDPNNMEALDAGSPSSCFATDEKTENKSSYEGETISIPRAKLKQIQTAYKQLQAQCARLTQAGKAQTAVLRNAYAAKMKDKDELVVDMLRTLKENKVMEPLQALSARNARIGAWSAMALGETMDIGGVCTEEELEELRKDRTELKSTLADMKSAMAASKNPDAGLKMKVKELKKDAKKLEKENAKLLEGLQRAQSSSGGGGDGGGDGGEEKNKLLAKIEKLTKKMEKMKTEKSSSGDPPSSGGGADPKELAAAKQETASLAAKLSEVQGKYDKLKGEFKDSQSLAGKNQEEIMNTMAQEVEKLEKGKAAVEKELEGAMEKLEKGKAAVEKKLEGAMEKLESALEKNKKMEKINEKLKGASGELAGQLTVIRKKGEGVSRDFGKLKQFVQLQMATEVPKIAGATTMQIQSATAAFMDSIKDLRKNYELEVSERKRLFNLVQELRGNIRVFCRCRPPSKKELSNEGGAAEIIVGFPATGEVTMRNDKGKSKNWEFDQVFDTDSTQEGVYKEVSPLVTSVLDGFNVCIFAYGQTGTGKTFTMMGPEDNRGVNTRALYELFDLSDKRRKTIEDKIIVSVLEVYNEQIKDLLADDVGERKYTVREGPHGNYVPDLTMVNVDSLDEVIELLALADTNRSTAKTNMNEHSSRSHLILSCYIHSTNKHSGEVSRGKLHLIDLAGSERVGKSGASGVALKEAQNINKSLSALGDVISARGAGSSHIPFRNSTLTQLLQDSLSNQSKTLMFVCISPVMYNAEEGFCSLNFAERTRKVELGKANKNIEKAGK